MTIRKTLLLAFLLVGVTPAAVLALLGFARASAALQAEIEQGLTAQAGAIASDVDRLMYERVQNALTWSRLEVMQDLQVADVDKRLANVLHRLHSGYGGLYRRLEAVDGQGRVAAASDPAGTGRPAGALTRWQQVALGDDRVSLDWPASTAIDGERRDVGGAAPPAAAAASGASGAAGAAGASGTSASATGAGSTATPASPGLTLRAPIASAFGNGALGELRLTVDWTQIDRLLDAAAEGGRLVALIDGQGRLVAGSRALLGRLPRFSADLAEWAREAEAGSVLLNGPAPLPEGAMIAGLGRAKPFAGFGGFGWKVLVVVPRSDGLAPVRAMGAIFAALLAALVAATLVASGWVSREIARPIVALTEFARSVKAPGQARVPPPAAQGREVGEVGELREAFVQMVADIDQSQQKLSRASALAAVGEMSAVIAHEVRTPLGILRSSAQVLRREPGLTDESRELLGFIESETQRLNGLVSSMLDSARPRAPHFAPADLHELVRQTVAMLAAQATKQGVRFTTDLASSDPVLSCDAEQMTQVLLNLMLNGLQILTHGGQMQISTRDEPAQLVVEVADDGPGIAPEARARIFEAFFFQREGGLGLGLAIVQKIVAAHGGDIEAGDSALGGAMFRIRLPRQ